MIGMPVGNSQTSLFVFCREILGYDLASFFERNSEVIRREIYTTLEALLRA